MLNISKQMIIHFGQTLDLTAQFLFLVGNFLPEVRYFLFHSISFNFHIFSIIGISIHVGSRSLKWRKKKDEEDLEELQQEIDFQSVINSCSKSKTK